MPVDRQKLLTFIGEIDALLHEEHQEDYCGIVYTDSKDKPRTASLFATMSLADITLDDALRRVPELKALRDSDERYAKLIEYARQMRAGVPQPVTFC